MINNWRKSVAMNIVSPLGLALFSYSIFLIAWSFPPEAYAGFVNEPDRMYLNWQLLSFYTCCVGSFLGGYYIHQRWLCRRCSVKAVSIENNFACLILAAPIVICSVGSGIFLMKLSAKIDFISMLASHQGNSIKAAGIAGELVSGVWASTVVFLTATLWWALYRYQQITLRTIDRFVFAAVFSVGLLIDLLVCVATVDRTSLMPVVGGLFIVYLFKKTSRTRPPLASLIITALSIIIFLVGIFIAMSLLRGASAFKFLVASLLGYSIVSYNRLAALLAGSMTYAYGGRGAYLFPFAVRNDRLNSIVPLRAYFGWPTGDTQFLSEFTSVSAAGLNPAYIWSGAFGYIYSDIGWWSLLYLAFLGVLAGYLWSAFRSGTALGVVSYLWIAFSILFWMGANNVFHERMIRFVVAGIALSLYDKLVVTAPLSKGQAPNPSWAWKSV